MAEYRAIIFITKDTLQTFKVVDEKYEALNSKGLSYINYNSDTTIDSFDYHYISGYTQYYYTDSGYFYTYEDGKTTSTPTSTSYYSSKTAYTVEQANSKLTELKSSF